MPERRSSPVAETAKVHPPQVRRFVELVSDLSVVEHVALGYDADVIRLWCIADRYDVEAFEGIFDRQRMLYEEWPGLECDFFVLAREGRSLESLLPPGFEVIRTASRRREHSAHV